MSTRSRKRGIVVGIDGSDSAVNAARWAAFLARRLDEPIHLVHVHPHGPDNGAEPAEAVIELAELAVRDVAGDVALESSALSGRPARTLSELSGSARMLVLGHTTTSELQSMFRRSEVVYIANHAECPVVTWRGKDGFTPPDGRPIVVGVDGSELSTAAIEQGYTLAATLDAPLVAVHTWSEQSTLTYGEGSRFTDWTDYVEHEKAGMAESLAGWAQRYPDVQVVSEVMRGKPDIVLLEQSAKAQLVVVGSHGRSAQSAALLGSTSQNLIHHSFCPVAICRAR